MQIEPPLRQLGQFGKTSGDRDAWYRVRAQIFQHATSEITHVDERLLVQIMQGGDGRFRSRTGCPRDMGEPCRARHVDTAVNGVNPG